MAFKASNDERLRLIRDVLQKTDFDALICRLPENVLMLSGHWSTLGSSLVIFPAGGEPVLALGAGEVALAQTTGWIEDLRVVPAGHILDASPKPSFDDLVCSAAEELRISGGVIGYEGGFEMVAPPYVGFLQRLPWPGWVPKLEGLLPTAKLLDATDLLRHLRSRKTSVEVERIRRANRVASRGLEAFKAAAVPGNTVAQVMTAAQGAVTRYAAEYGAFRAHAWANVSSGAASAGEIEPPKSARPGPVVLSEGDLVLMDLGTVVDGYWSDTTRTVVAGKASPRQWELYSVVLEAQRQAADVVRPGATGGEVDAAARTVIEAAGLGDNFCHHTGHGVGFVYFEDEPLLVPGSDSQLQQGTTHVLEPGVYIPGFGGIRVEDDFVVRATGVERLSHTEFDLD